MDIERALKAEWNSQWTASEMGAALRDLLPRVDTAWWPLDVGNGSRADLLGAARFLMGHCHIGTFRVPWHADDDI